MTTERQATDARFDFRLPLSCGERAFPDYNKVIIFPIYYIHKTRRTPEEKTVAVAAFLCNIYGF